MWARNNRGRINESVEQHIQACFQDRRRLETAKAEQEHQLQAEIRRRAAHEAALEAARAALEAGQERTSRLEEEIVAHEHEEARRRDAAHSAALEGAVAVLAACGVDLL